MKLIVAIAAMCVINLALLPFTPEHSPIWEAEPIIVAFALLGLSLTEAIMLLLATWMARTAVTLERQNRHFYP